MIYLRRSTRINKVYGTFNSVYLFYVLLAIGFIFPVGTAKGADDHYLDSLISLARVENLHRDRNWQILLHYKPTDAASPKSLVDDQKFFLAPDGKTNPAGELEMTLRGLFRDDLKGDDAIRCRFPARFAWLQERLGIDSGRLPAVNCQELDEALSAADPKRTVLVFPSAFINSPASMFGHTLLRVDNGYQSELLAYAVNYSAKAENETNGFAYAFKGIFGLYRGYYSVSPYYEKVKEYNDIEHRDIWEYHLALTEDETRRIVLHVWELKGIYSDYYFFDENCSYNVLFLLESARPSVNLTDRLPLWVIPSDTIRVVRDAGLVTAIKYRPSQGTRIRHLSSFLASNDQQVALDIANGRTSSEAVQKTSRPAPEKGRIFELAAEFLQYRYSHKELEKDEYNRMFHATLKERSLLGQTAGSVPPVPEPIPPDEGHATAKVGLDAGTWQGRFFTELSGRFAYHDIMDQDDGYINGAQIKFGDTAIRIYPGDGQTQLQRLHFIDILSLTPRSLMFKPLSWKVNTGFDQEVMHDGDEHLLFRLNTGGGLTWDAHGMGLLFIMAETDLNLSDTLQDFFGLGLGMSAGLVSNATGAWKIGLFLSGFYYPIFEEHTRLQAVLVQNFRINRNNGIAMSIRGEHTFGYDRYEAKVGWNLFF